VSNRFVIGDDIVAAVPESGVIASIATENEDDKHLENALEAAVELASRTGASIMLYDRSQETWGDTDHSHPMARKDVDTEESPHLARAFSITDKADVPVAVWRSTIPSIGTGVLNVVQKGGADVIVVPADGGGDGNLISNLLLGGSNDVADAVQSTMESPVAKQAGAEIVVIAVSEDDQLRLG